MHAVGACINTSSKQRLIRNIPMNLCYVCTGLNDYLHQKIYGLYALH